MRNGLSQCRFMRWRWSCVFRPMRVRRRFMWGSRMSGAGNTPTRSFPSTRSRASRFVRPVAFQKRGNTEIFDSMMTRSIRRSISKSGRHPRRYPEIPCVLPRANPGLRVPLANVNVSPTGVTGSNSNGNLTLDWTFNADKSMLSGGFTSLGIVSDDIGRSPT